MFINIIKRYKGELFLLALVTLIGLINYSPDKFLSGWDSLQTELYPSLGIKRAFFFHLNATHTIRSFSAVSMLAIIGFAMMILFNERRVKGSKTKFINAKKIIFGIVNQKKNK